MAFLIITGERLLPSKEKPRTPTSKSTPHFYRESLYVYALLTKIVMWILKIWFPGIPKAGPWEPY